VPTHPEVIVRKLKFDGSAKYAWPGTLVEMVEDDWAVVHHDPRRHEKVGAGLDLRADGSDRASMLHYVGLARPVSVLFAFSRVGKFLEAKCDAALPATRIGNMIDFVDLDLDVVMLPGGAHYIRDQEVFAERSIAMGYSEEAKRQAHLGILHALRMVRRKQFPFDGHAERLATAFS
jgi:hypothetical protein